ncbi:Trigger factor (TF) [Acetoanaerobium sticklandii]|uniref:Trigger factor n=1 Tax=Acetoanaerobium sticklandii (strain ATCC 12662 / DSM 519 / JCM 1433 / CCUG 9281 / NCIMB 10654 / HF) TaxID=499177 RepID=E3PWA0_ACESD|nr:trigger factor [Acetoanaerobium sticklandii]CBH20715.1 Trigger factor (TF) [Acetoanaerobium sticklandii]
MSSEILKKENSVVTLKLTIDAQSFDKACKDAYNKNKTKFNVQGFRKGKAPMSIVEKFYGEGVFFEDAVNTLFPDAFEVAVKEHDLDTVARPEIDVEEIGKGKNLVIIADVAVKPEISLGEYKNLTVEKPDSEVSDEEVEKEIEAMREQNARFVTVEDREVKEKDMLLIDFNGKVDGVEFEGGQAENYSIIVGSDTFIPGFEEQLIGMKLNEEKDLSVKFPEEYHAENLAGKDAIFTVKVNEIKEKELPELDDEFAKDVSEFDTLEDLKADAKAKLQKTKDEYADREIENKLVKMAAENATVEIPEAMIDSQVENMVYDFEYQLKYQGLDLENYLKFTNMSIEGLKEQMRPDAKSRVLNSLVIEAISKSENIESTEEDLEQELAKMAESYKMEVDKLKSTLRPSDMDYIKDTVVARKTVEFIKGNANLQ